MVMVGSLGYPVTKAHSGPTNLAPRSVTRPRSRSHSGLLAVDDVRNLFLAAAWMNSDAKLVSWAELLI